MVELEVVGDDGKKMSRRVISKDSKQGNTNNKSGAPRSSMNASSHEKFKVINYFYNSLFFL